MVPTESNYHGISEMSRVDFIVELEKAILFVEVKDPEHPSARPEGLKKFMDELNDGKLCETFTKKFIDSFLYRWAEDQLTKPIHYINLVTLDKELLSNLTDQITKKLPPFGKSAPRWKRRLCNNCQVFNIETWNENFPKWPVKRISQTTQGSG